MSQLIAYDPVIHRIGKKEPKHDPRTLQFAKYLTALPPIPAKRAWSAKASPDFGLMLNDKLGDCTCAGMGHGVQIWTAANGNEITPPDADILNAYEGACHYNPADPSSDQGGIELDVLNWWTKNPVGGVTIDAFTALEPGNHKHVEAAIDLFGFAYIGVALPISAQNQIGGIWSIVRGPNSAPGSWGGHCVIVVDYDEKLKQFVCVTWGKTQRMTYAWWDRYTDEAYACLSEAWATTKPGDLAPSGFDYAALQSDLGALRAAA